MKNDLENKKVILMENYKLAGYDDNTMTLKEYAIRESENDPDFFRWLFNDYDYDDFECPNKQTFEKFINSL